MPESNPPAPPSISQVRAHLRTIAQLLRDVNHLGPESQHLLAQLVDELSQALESDSVPSSELAHLAECTAQLVKAAQQRDEPGILGNARERLDRAVLAIEGESPLVAGLARRLTETLSNLGI